MDLNEYDLAPASKNFPEIDFTLDDLWQFAKEMDFLENDNFPIFENIYNTMFFQELKVKILNKIQEEFNHIQNELLEDETYNENEKLCIENTSLNKILDYVEENTESYINCRDSHLYVKDLDRDVIEIQDKDDLSNFAELIVRQHFDLELSLISD